MSHFRIIAFTMLLSRVELISLFICSLCLENGILSFHTFLKPPKRISRLLVVEEAQRALLFNKLADKRLLLDVEGAGTPEMTNCCHGGCDNCDFSRIFDEMNSGRPKWVPVYSRRKLIDGREHFSSWSTVLFEDKEEISQEEFVTSLKKIKSQMTLGAPSVPSTEELTDEACIAFYETLRNAKPPSPDTLLSINKMSQALEALTENEHGAMFGDFNKIFD
jgi:hypothetical protein